jgi:hypothetical protein
VITSSQPIRDDFLCGIDTFQSDVFAVFINIGTDYMVVKELLKLP